MKEIFAAVFSALLSWSGATAHTKVVAHDSKWIIAFKTRTHAARCRPRNVSVVDQFSRYVVLKSKTEPKLSELNRACPGVELIRPNVVYRLSAEVAPAIPTDTFEDRWTGWTAPEGKCQLMDPGTPDKLDMTMTNTDLMHRELRDMGIRPNVLPPIAVVDGGCNHARERFSNLIDVKQEVAPTNQVPHAGRVIYRIQRELPNTRINCYGTFTASGADSVELIKGALLNACKNDGAKVINASFAKDDHMPLLESHPSLKKDLEAEGCVVIQASGNRTPFTTGSYYRNGRRPREDLLTVSSLNMDGDRTSSTSPGSIAAPGEDLSTDDTANPGLSGGSSFSSSTVTAITQSVYAVLEKQSAAFRNIENPQKVAIVTRIVRESARPQTTQSDRFRESFRAADGYRAVMLAKAVAGSNLNLKDPAKLDQSFVKRELNSAAARFRDSERCSEMKESNQCPQQRKCYHNKRRYLALTDQPAPRPILEDLNRTTETSADQYLQSYWNLRINQPSR